MTARTHDLAAFSALTLAVIYGPNQTMNLATALVAFGANMIGGLFPDLDESTAEIWDKLRGGSILAKLISPLLGGHRLISHSLLGWWFFGWLVQRGLALSQTVLIVDQQIVWSAFMLGYLSHLLMDSLTREGVPWLFPIPWNIGLPPIRWLRFKTGGIGEKSIIFPGLVALNAYLGYTHYSRIVELFRGLVR